MSYCLGADLGTSAIKITLCDEKGNVVSSIEKEYPLSIPFPSYSEQDPHDWVRAFFDGVKELAKGREKEISSICIDGQMHGLVALDEQGEVIRPCILWNDSRSEKECVYLNEEIGKEVLLKETGNIAYPGFTLPKILWMRNHEKENYDRIKTVLLPKDYLNYVLTGVLSSDYSDAAGTLVFDVEKKCWSKKMIEISGLEESCYPSLCDTGTLLGKVKKEILEELGIQREVRVYQGAADNAAAAIGNGIILEGECNISLGTSGTIFVNSKKYTYDEKGAIHSFYSGTSSYCLLACMLSAASSLKWLNDNIFFEKDYNKDQEKIKEENLGRNHVYFLPYLMGERSPINDPKAKGVLFGLGMDNQREDITQAVLEGVCFALKDSLLAIKRMGVEIKESYLTGGGSRSSLWKRMLSSILNIPLYSVTSYGPSYGMALVALVSEGHFKSLEEAKREHIEVKEKIFPEKELVALYEERYQEFSRIYPSVKSLF